MKRLNLDRWLALPVLLVVLVVVSLRGIGLARDGGLPNAHEERTWFAWAYRVPGVVERFAAIEGELLPGESVLVVLPEHSSHREWWRVMAQYYLPEQRLVGVVGEPLLTMEDLDELGAFSPETRFSRWRQQGFSDREILLRAQRAAETGTDAILARRLKEKRAGVWGPATILSLSPSGGLDVQRSRDVGGER